MTTKYVHIHTNNHRKSERHWINSLHRPNNYCFKKAHHNLIKIDIKVKIRITPLTHCMCISRLTSTCTKLSCTSLASKSCKNEDIITLTLYTWHLLRIICFTIMSFSWWSFPSFSWPYCLNQQWYLKEKLQPMGLWLSL